MKIDSLKNLARFIGSGCTPSRKNISYWNSADVFWLKTEQLGEYKITSTAEQISHKAVTECNLRIYPKNTISVAMYGEGKTRGNVSLLDAPMTTNQACCNIEIDDAKIDYQYVYYYLKGQYENLRQLSAGVRKNLNADDIKNFLIRYPENKATQNKIVALLGAIDDKIALNKKNNATLEAMAKTLYMHEFFRKPPNGKLNDIVIENSKSIIPVGAAKSTGGKFPFFTSGDSVLSWTDSLVDGRNIFLNTGGNAGAKFYVGKAAYSTDTWCITAKNLADYLYLLLKVIELELDNKFFQGTGLKHLQKPLLKEREIYIPTKTEREKFNAIVQPCFTKISANVQESRRLAELRDWLLPMLMNGQIDFKEKIK